MKNTFPSIFLNLFLFTTTISPLTAIIIQDSSGNKLVHGIPYYILPLLRGSGGGDVSQTTKTACPLNITQEPFELNHGVPFTFNPIVLDEQFVHGAYPLSIEANVINPCSGSMILKVTSTTSSNDSNLKKKHDDDDDDVKDVVGIDIVTTDGEFNKPESCFQIVEDIMMPGLQSYQIQNCPFKCGSSGDGFTCYNVGIVMDGDGNGNLGRTDTMFPVVFESSYGMFSRLGHEMRG